jgi:hypothetical protein
MNVLISYQNYYRFKARLYLVPTMQNIMGIDPYPRYFLRPTKLIEVMEYAEKPQSIDDGYVKDESSGLYLRNHSKLNDGTVSQTEVEFQYLNLSMNPPYWFSNSASYVAWIQINMEQKRSNMLQSMFNLYDMVKVRADVDDDIPVEHFYVEFEDWTTKKFSEVSATLWPRTKGINFR